MKKEVLSQNFYSMSAHFVKASLIFYHTNNVPYIDLTRCVSGLFLVFCVSGEFVLRGVFLEEYFVDWIVGRGYVLWL
jgi:hypothetical protein